MARSYAARAADAVGAGVGVAAAATGAGGADGAGTWATAGVCFVPRRARARSRLLRALWRRGSLAVAAAATTCQRSAASGRYPSVANARPIRYSASGLLG